MVCGNSLSPGLTIAVPFANTENCDALVPITVVQACPVLARSLLFLDIAGMPVFMDAKNLEFIVDVLGDWAAHILLDIRQLSVL